MAEYPNVVTPTGMVHAGAMAVNPWTRKPVLGPACQKGSASLRFAVETPERITCLRCGAAKERGRIVTTILTLAEVEAGMSIKPIPGTYRSKITAAERKGGTKAVTLTFGEEWAGSKFKSVTRTGAAKRFGTVDIGFAGGGSWHAYPGTVKVEVKTARTRKVAEPTADMPERKTVRTRKQKAEQAPEPTKAARKPSTAKAAKNNDEVQLSAAVKKLRDEGMAWWKIGVELSLKGAGPLPKGKAGAGQARRLYKLANDGVLPTSARSNGGSRTLKNTTPRPAQRKRAALGLSEMSPAEVKGRIEGKTITYNYDKAELGTADPLKVEKIKRTNLIAKSGRLAVTFWSERSREGYGNERTVYVDQIVEVR